MVRLLLWLFVTVTVLAVLFLPTTALAKLRDVGAAVTAFTPEPLNARFCGEPVALSFTRSVSARDPNAAGVNATEMVQVPFDANVAGLSGHVVVHAYSAKLAVMLVIVSALVSPLLRVTVLTALVVPTTWFPYARFPGDNVTDPAPKAGLLAQNGTNARSVQRILEGNPIEPFRLS